MVANRSKGKVVFVSSILGYMSIVGYSSYSPAKWALRGETNSRSPSTPVAMLMNVYRTG